MTDMNDTLHQRIAILLAFVGGTGFVLMVVALAVGVIQGANTNNPLVSGLFVGGTIALIAASVGYVGVFQPYKHFDDINVPHYTGHDHHDHDAHDHQDSDAANAVEPIVHDIPPALRH